MPLIKSMSQQKPESTPELERDGVGLGVLKSIDDRRPKGKADVFPFTSSPTLPIWLERYPYSLLPSPMWTVDFLGGI